MSTFHLAQAIDEHGHVSELGSWLRATAEDEAVDDLNRMRAVQVLFHVAIASARRESSTLDDDGLRALVVGELRALKSADAAKIWLQVR
jgi:hypothetical protein